MRLLLPLLCALAMSVGWGFRGDYGHEAGAMVPGALVALAACLASGREDWWKRASLLAMLGGLGWAFGGQMSYGKIVGYTAHSSYPDVAYGYACLFVIGALWGGVGAGLLALGVTRPRSELERAAGPLVAVYAVWLALSASGAAPRLAALVRDTSLHDADWLSASSALAAAGVYGLVARRSRPACLLIACLAIGWLLGYGLLRVAAGLRMTPPRGDNWAGCLGLFVALVGWLVGKRDRAALLLALYGFLAGGIGFAAGDFVNMLGRAQWGPVGRYEALQNLDSWKWMEQGFGFLMGGGVGLGFARLLRGGLAPAAEDETKGPLGVVALVFLFVVMMWENLFKNVRNWARDGHLRDGLFGLDPRLWFLGVGVLLTAAVLFAILRHRRGELSLVPATAFGRAQLLFLLLLWVPVLAAFMQAFPSLTRKGALFVHVTFWLTGLACTFLVLALSPKPAPREATTEPESRSWRPGWRMGLVVLLVPALVLLLAWLSVASHAEPLGGSHLRFE